ncbi:transcription factor GTE9-like isoform X2 [Typha angustifolia]|uniref:transcription factor GTE9-like isoform X2 n=1 Tax=Typha angustifolia TaxID=59011 RepID=UPI003C2F753E
MSKKRKAPGTDRGQKHLDFHFDVEETVFSRKCEAIAATVTVVSKRNPLGGLTNTKGKCEKMGITKIRQCSNILMKLMNHPFGWVFNHPVDPVKLNIPDYFSIISKPMDLGTIRHNLASKLYNSTHQFAADVRLTFSNAMQYNPPGNEVHNMAKELDDIFSSAWKSLEGQWRKGNSDLGLQTVSLRPVTVKLPSGCSNLSSRRSLTYAEKLKLRKDLATIPIRNMPPRLLNFLQKEFMLEKSEERINLEIDMHNEETLFKLHQMLRSSLDAKLLDVIRKCGQDSAQGSCKGSGETRLTSADAKVESLPRFSDRADTTCATMGRCLTRKGNFTQQFPGGECYSQRPVSCDLEHIKTLSRARLGDPSCELDVVEVGDSDKVISPFQPSDPAISEKGNNSLPFEEPLSPTRALRAAMLKSRFADTIVKAQQRALLDHGKQIDPAKLQLEREKLERRQQEEKARIEAHVKAAEAAARMKAEADMKMQREKEREAARLALQKMEKTVEIDNSEILKDIESLSYCQMGITMPDEMLINVMYGNNLHSGPANPLERLGLFIKNDDLEEEVEEWISAVNIGDVEEGEISCC